MKLRIKGNSVRYRLTRSDIDTFMYRRYIEEFTDFGGSILIYALESKDGIDTISASFNNNKLLISMPEEWVNTWATTDKVGYDSNMDIGYDRKMCILLEKDFKCLDESHGDQSDSFDHPLLTSRSEPKP
ncbi:MAG: hypothetical protein WCG87_10285 [Bacteroidota bacterium]